VVGFIEQMAQNTMKKDRKIVKWRDCRDLSVRKRYFCQKI